MRAAAEDAAAEEGVLDAAPEADEGDDGHRLVDLQAGPAAGLPQGVLVEVLEMPRQVEVEPARAEAAAMPRAPIRDGDDDGPAVGEASGDGGEVGDRIAHVLQRVADDHDVIPGEVGRDVVQRAKARIDALCPGRGHRALGGVEAVCGPTAPGEDRDEVAAAAA